MATITRQAKIEYLYDLMGFVSKNAVQYGFSQKKIKEIELATEEALVNIINYAYKDDIGDVKITCKQDGIKHFIIEIVDTGRDFDVLSKEEPDTTSDINEREIGGLGLFIMKKLMDEIRYHREEGKNILTLIVQKY